MLFNVWQTECEQLRPLGVCRLAYAGRQCPCYLAIRRCDSAQSAIVMVFGLLLYFACLALRGKVCSCNSNRTSIKFLAYSLGHYYFERWITRIVYRWRAQQNAIFNVNCRTPWTSISWTHIAAIGSPVAMFVWGSAVYLSCHLMYDVDCDTSIVLLSFNVRRKGFEVLLFNVWRNRFAYGVYR